MKQTTTKAIVLKRINFGEADRILTLITSTEGRISLLAKGVRRPKSKLAGGLELFAVNDITYIEGKSELKTAVSTRIDKHFGQIGKNVDRTMIAYELLKAIDQYTKAGVETGIFEIIAEALEALDTKNIEQEIVFVWFVVHLLALYGSGLNLEKPLDMPKFEENKNYSFSGEDMSFYGSETGELRPIHIKFLRLVTRSNLPEKLKLVESSVSIASDLTGLCRQILLMHKA